MKLESKIGKITKQDEEIYNFISDFNNFQSLIPADKVKNWRSDKDSCSFTIDMIGETGFRIIEKEPFKLIKLANLEQSKYDFKFWVQLKDLGENNTAIKLTMDVELNPMFQMMAKKPLQEFLNSLVDKLSQMEFKND